VADTKPATAPAAERARAWRRRLLLLAALAAAAIGVVAGVVLASRDGVRHGGPLSCARCASILEGMPLDVHRAGTEGAVVVLNRGKRDAALEGITYERLTPGLRILGPLALRVGDYRGPGLVAGLARAYPPRTARGITRPVRGFVVHPYRRHGDAVEVLTGFTPLRPGVFGYRALAIRYHIGRRRYVARYPFALVVCAPEASYDSSCHPKR
jgi:hypothetical protein